MGNSGYTRRRQGKSLRKRCRTLFLPAYNFPLEIKNPLPPWLERALFEKATGCAKTNLLCDKQACKPPQSFHRKFLRLRSENRHHIPGTRTRHLYRLLWQCLNSISTRAEWPSCEYGQKIFPLKSAAVLSSIDILRIPSESVSDTHLS